MPSSSVAGPESNCAKRDCPGGAADTDDLEGGLLGICGSSRRKGMTGCARFATEAEEVAEAAFPFSSSCSICW